jgi:predicted nucleic acid-binding protein
MTVVSDTSPVTNLMQIGQLSLLQKVFGMVILPEAVYEELCAIPAQKTIVDQQNWLFVQKPADEKLVAELKKELDKGEAEAIALALELKADALIIDELKGRNKAEQVGLRIIGLLGTLLEAKRKGLIPAVKPLMDDLVSKAGFKIRPALYQQVLKISGE